MQRFLTTQSNAHQPQTMPAPASGPRQPTFGSHAGIMRLQRQIGNREVTSLLQSGRGDSLDQRHSAARYRAGEREYQPADLIVSSPSSEIEREAQQIESRIASQHERDLSVAGLPAHASPDEAVVNQPKHDGTDRSPRMLRANSVGGQPLPVAPRRFMESRFGASFSDVRLHTDAAAQRANRILRSQAFTAGEHVFIDTGHDEPKQGSPMPLLGHELAHVVQQRSMPVAGLLVMRKPDDAAGQGRYPTAAERQQVLDILNPQQQAAARAGVAVPQVTDPDGFAAEMKTRMNDYIDLVLPGANARKASSVTIGEPVVDSLGDIAETTVQDAYGSNLRAARHSPSEQRRRASYRLREHLHLVPTTVSAETLDVARNWVASRMRKSGGDILDRYHVLSGDGVRDNALFERVRNEIVNGRQADVFTIVLFQASFTVSTDENGEEYKREEFIQPHIVPREPGESRENTLRRGRWDTLGTVIHEMLHAVVHERFNEVVHPLERSGIAVEGFAEYFTRPVYDSMVDRAERDVAFRTSIEGVARPFDRSLSVARRDYQRYLDAVVEIQRILGSGDTNLKLAYFEGRVEYIGLGGWNPAEAARQRFPGNTLGFGALLTDTGGGFFRVDYGRVVAGRGGDLQLHLGGTINYLTDGGRLGLGGTALLQYSGENVYIRGGLGAGGSVSPGQPFAGSVRLDLIPGAEAGVRIGVVRVGAGLNLLIPIAGGPIDARVTRVAGGIGLSLDL